MSVVRSISAFIEHLNFGAYGPPRWGTQVPRPQST
jgi:hypothetical protein